METSIARSLEKIFGENTNDFKRYSPASDIQWQAGIYTEDYPQLHHYQQGTKKNIGHSIAILEQAVRALHEEIADASERPGPTTPAGAVTATQIHPHRVFIGHGRSLLWKELKDFIQDRLSLPWASLIACQ